MGGKQVHVPLKGNSWAAGCIACALLAAIAPRGIAFLSVYLFTGPSALSLNLVLLELLAAFLGSFTCPWLVGLDNDMEPDDWSRLQ